MRNEVKGSNLEVLSLLKTDNKISLIQQKAVQYSIHRSDDKYLILQDTKKSKEIGIGLFNNKTKFIVSSKNSLIIYKDGDIKSLNLEENNNGWSLVYIYPYIISEILKIKNKSLKIKSNRLTKVIDLTYDFGYRLGIYLKYELESFSKTEELFKNKFIKSNDYGITLNEQLILNSNEEFLVGILDGIFDKSNLIENINIYSITLILNYLGSWFSVNNLDKNKQVRFKLPKELKKYSKLRNSYFKREEEFINLKNNVKGCLIPIETLKFKKIEDDDKIYDLTMENHNATNYCNSFTPFMKNSDGDILFCTGIWSKEGLEDSKSFSPENKMYYRDLKNGNINNYIQHDAVLGLYNATNHLK